LSVQLCANVVGGPVEHALKLSNLLVGYTRRSRRSKASAAGDIVESMVTLRARPSSGGSARAAIGGHRRRWIALVVVSTAMLMNALDQTIVNVALPTIQRDLHFSQAELAWVIDAYLITFGGFLLVAGRLGDLVGRKKVFLAGLAVFTLSSLVCGLAPNQGLLIGARFVQGAGAALSSSVALAIIVAEFTKPTDRARAMSAYIITAVGGGSLGLLVGGIFTQALSWHWIFFINLPIGVAAMIAGWLLIDENVGSGIRQGVDIGGAILSTAGLMLLIYAIVSSAQYGWHSAHTFEFLAAAIVVLVAFGVLEHRLANPMMPFRIFRARGLLSTSVVRGFMAPGLFGTFFIGALLLQRVLGYDAIRTGLAFLPQSLTIGGMSLGVTGIMMRRLPPKWMALGGLCLLGGGLSLFSVSGPHTAYFPHMFFAFLMTGVGACTAFTPLITIAVADVPKEDAGLGSGVVNVTQQVAAAIAVAVLGTAATDRTATLAHHGHPDQAALLGGYRFAFALAVGSVVISVVSGLLFLRSPRPTKSEPLLSASSLH
jgi:EmrB/QacA subfamily drug resistance transporter